MADQELKLRITTVGGRSIVDLEKDLKGLLAQFKGLPIASKEFKALGGQVKGLRDQLAEARKAAESSGSAMMRSYFQTGEAIRSKAIPSVIEFNRIIQDAPFGLQGMINNVQRLSETFLVLQRDAGGVGAGIKAMMSSIVTGPMGIMVAISAVTALIQLFGKDLVAAIRATKTEAALMVSEIRSIERFIDTQGRLYGFRQAQISGFSDNRITSELNVRTGFIGQLEADIAKRQAELDKTDDEQRQKNLNKEIELLQKRLTVEEKFLDALIQERQEREKIDAKNTEAGRAFDRAVARGMATGAGQLGGPGMPGQGPNQIGGAVPTGRSFKPGETFAGSLTEGAQAFQAFQSSVMSGTNAMASHLSSTIGQAFARVFGGANTLLGSFAQAFAQTMSELAAKYAIMLLLDAAFPGSGSALSAAGSIGGSGRVSMSPSAKGSSAQLQKIEQHLASLNLRIDSTGLYLATEAGRYKFARTAI